MISLDNGFHEVVAIVSSLDDAGPRLKACFGYETIHRGQPSAEALASLGVPEGWAAEEEVIGDPSQERGFLRLIAFPGQDLPLLRHGGKAWDTGGIFDLNIRALGPLEVLTERMNANGYVPFAPTTHWQFGELDVKEAVLNDPDGVCLAVMERVAPPLEGYEHVKSDCSYVFNSTQIVPDYEAARSFYVDTLGWKAVQETEALHEDGNNCMGLPPSVAKKVLMKIGIYQAQGVKEGSVEIIEMVDLEGLDFSDSRPPKRGLASLRFPVTDAQAILDRATAGGAEVVPLQEAGLAPYGKVRLGAVIAPWGARLDVFEIL